MHNYHKEEYKTKQYGMKVDLFKAYDMVNWKFILMILKIIGIHPLFINWIKECVLTSSFSICFNGELKGFFTSSRGVRQRDLISPYLFIIVMEVFSEIFGKTSLKKDFKFH